MSAVAHSLRDFLARVAATLSNLDLDLADVEGAEPMRVRASRLRIPDAIRDLAHRAERDHAVAFGTFHTYPLDDADATS